MKYIAFNFNKSLNIGVIADNAPSDIIQRMTFNEDYAFLSEHDLKKIDETFFEAYEFDKKAVIINIDKAKEIRLDHYRKARTSLIEKLDIDFMRAVESGNTQLQREIAAKKQALRDVTKTELPNTLEGIKNTWPEILGPKPF